jgi:glycosyltransferase involved in cell wall biosynthesis
VAWLQAADVVLLPFALPEAVEPPLTLLEALACGAVVLATPSANRSGIVRDGYNGFVYGEPAGFAQPLGRLITEPQIGHSVRACARQTVETGFGFTAVADATARLWTSLSHRGARSRRNGIAT